MNFFFRKITDFRDLLKRKRKKFNQSFPAEIIQQIKSVFEVAMLKLHSKKQKFVNTLNTASHCPFTDNINSIPVPVSNCYLSEAKVVDREPVTHSSFKYSIDIE